MVELKKKFGAVVSQVEEDFKNNCLAYKEKYYELIKALISLYKDSKTY